MTTNAIKNVLDDLGIRRTTRGYQYMLLAISLLLEDPPSFVKCFNTKMYPEIAKIYQKSPSSIERTLQRYVDSALDNGDPDLLCKILGAPVEKLSRRPTCTKFLIKVATYLDEN